MILITWCFPFVPYFSSDHKFHKKERYYLFYQQTSRVSLVARLVKNLPAVQETWV